MVNSLKNAKIFRKEQKALRRQLEGQQKKEKWADGNNAVMPQVGEAKMSEDALFFLFPVRNATIGADAVGTAICERRTAARAHHIVEFLLRILLQYRFHQAISVADERRKVAFAQAYVQFGADIFFRFSQMRGKLRDFPQS